MTQSSPIILADNDQPKVEILGRQSYEPVWQRMRDFTCNRTSASKDAIWVVEHHPVFTLGLNGKRHHILDAGAIPVVQVDRGGQVTYHGPGQLVIYLLLDLKRCGIGVRRLVQLIEDSVIATLGKYKLTAKTRPAAPGVYLDGMKIAALGLRIKNGCCYHGLSLNIKMDLMPFTQINPCGYAGMAVTQLSDHVQDFSPQEVQDDLLNHLLTRLQAIQTALPTLPTR